MERIADIGDIVGHYEVLQYSGARYICKCLYCDDISIKTEQDLRRAIKHVDTGRCRHKCAMCDNKRIERILNGMIYRCYDKTCKHYKFYGEKGIQVCEAWRHNHRKFEEWALENGYADNLTIDRIDPDKDYCPENCRWITCEENARWKSTTRAITVDEITMTGRQWADYLGIGTNRINVIIREQGIEEAISFISKVRNGELVPDRHKPDTVQYNGETVRVVDLARDSGVSSSSLRDRLSSGQEVEDAILSIKRTQEKRFEGQIEYNGEKHKLSEWAAIYGIAYNVVTQRVHNGWDRIAAFTTPARSRNSEKITVDGISKTGKEWARYMGLNDKTINDYRRKHGIEATALRIHKYMVEKE